MWRCGAGSGRNRPWQDPGLTAVNSGVCGPEPRVSPLGPQSPRSGSVGAGPAAGTPGVLSRHCARRLGPWPRSLSGQLCARSLSFPRVCAVTTGRVIREQLWLGLRGSCVGGAVLYGVHSLSFHVSGTRFLLSFTSVVVFRAGFQIHSSCFPSLALAINTSSHSQSQLRFSDSQHHYQLFVLCGAFQSDRIF